MNASVAPKLVSIKYKFWSATFIFVLYLQLDYWWVLLLMVLFNQGWPLVVTSDEEPHFLLTIILLNHNNFFVPERTSARPHHHSPIRPNPNRGFPGVDSFCEIWTWCLVLKWLISFGACVCLNHWQWRNSLWRMRCWQHPEWWCLPPFYFPKNLRYFLLKLLLPVFTSSNQFLTLMVELYFIHGCGLQNCIIWSLRG